MITIATTFVRQVHQVIDRARLAATSAEKSLAGGPDLSAAQVGNLRADVAGLRADLMALRVDLDATDVATLQGIERGDRTLRLWGWERELRAAMLGVDEQLRVLDERAEVYANGIRVRIHTVRAGETLQFIAAFYYSDWREWTRIAEANALRDELNLVSGQQLVIPEKR